MSAVPRTYDVPSLPLIEALRRLSEHTGITVGGSRIDPALRSRAVRGRMSVEAALRHLLIGTGLRAVKVGAGNYRLDPAATARPAPPALAAPLPEQEIIVTATKRARRLSLMDGNVERVDFATPLGIQASHGSASDLAGRLPSLSSTALGPGQNKLFLRGIADTSFTGRTQATLGEYLGEARINFNGPDPGLLLYDVRSVELLKGPQGTLYGGGTLSGVLRIEPERPDLVRWSGFVDAALTGTQHGGMGSALAGVINVPLAVDHAGLRLLGYRRDDAGYIDDAGRGMRDVNHSRTVGARAQARVKAGGWTVDLLGAHQTIKTDDGNYAVAGVPPLTRSTALAQPADNRFDLVNLQVHGGLAGIDLLSTTSALRNDLSATYDASVVAGEAAAFVNARDIKALSHETRLTHSSADGSGWIVGFAGLIQDETTRQRADAPLAAIYNLTFDSRRVDVELFAQASHRFGRFLLTGGARLTRSWVDGDTDITLLPSEQAFLHRHDIHPSPMVQLSWFGSDALTVSASYRQGFRANGVTVFRLPTGIYPTDRLVSPYRSDAVRVLVVDGSYRTKGAHPLALTAALSLVDWSGIQADYIFQTGFPVTVNLPSSNLTNLDLSGSWQLRSNLSISGGISLTTAISAVHGDGAIEEVASVPHVAWNVEAAWSHALGDGYRLGIEGRVTYRGKSRLGWGDLHDIEQGQVVDASLAARLARGRYSASLTIQNLANDRSSLFGYGNPFTFQNERQITPLRPRSATLGLRADF
ncbi:TonB-dependent receptor domain-containing protein [Sphingomonas sp. ASY06-1R]|uniref:TonB-dependent receptor domain-containing protein n=1 Tax=Sphingomonas sp. ASY06-1R TaxID=3445771 RepID=UPI003FA217F3